MSSSGVQSRVAPAAAAAAARTPVAARAAPAVAPQRQPTVGARHAGKHRVTDAAPCSSASVASRPTQLNASAGAVGGGAALLRGAPSASSARSAQRSPPAAASQPAQASGTRHAAAPRSSSATGPRGRVAETPAERVARVLRKREALVAAIRAGVQRSGKGAAAAVAALLPLEQLLPSPPEALIHQMALLWMAPVAADSAEPRGAPLRLHLRQSFSKGTELQLLCAMAGLPVLPASGNNQYYMGKYLYAAVRLYAEQNEHLFAEPATPATVAWDATPLTDHLCTAVAKAAREAVREVEATRTEAGHMHTSDVHMHMDDVHMHMAGVHMHMAGVHMRMADAPAAITAVQPASPPPYDAAVGDILTDEAPVVGPLPPALSAADTGVAQANDSSALLSLSLDPAATLPEKRDSSQLSPGPEFRVPASPSLGGSVACPTQAPGAAAAMASGITARGADDGHPESEAAVADPILDLLQALHPESTVAMADILQQPACPHWLAAALRTLQPPGGRTPPLHGLKQRLIMAAATAQEVHALMESQTDAAILALLKFSPRRMLQDPSGSDLQLGNGVSSGALRVTCSGLNLTVPANFDHYCRVDAAQRLILRQLWTGDLVQSREAHAWISALKRLATEGVPAGIPGIAALPQHRGDQPAPVYTAVAGDGHCWYSCVALAEAKSQKEVQAAVTAALQKQSTAPPACLSLVRLVDSDSEVIDVTDHASAKRAVQASLSTKRLRDMHYAGDPEMVLYSMATKGAVRFLVLASEDMQANWAAQLRDFHVPVPGQVSLDLSMNYLFSYEIQSATGAPLVDYANTTGNTVAGPQYRWKLFTTVGYAIGPVSTRLSWRHLPSLPSIIPGALPNDAYNELDLYGVWSVADHLTLRAGVENVANAQPPVVGRIPGVSNNYGTTDPTYYDVLGRRYFIGVTARF